MLAAAQLLSGASLLAECTMLFGHHHSIFPESFAIVTSLNVPLVINSPSLHSRLPAITSPSTALLLHRCLCSRVTFIAFHLRFCLYLTPNILANRQVSLCFRIELLNLFVLRIMAKDDFSSSFPDGISTVLTGQGCCSTRAHSRFPRTRHAQSESGLSPVARGFQIL